MCFSATASFGAGVVLCSAGILTMKKVQERSRLPFAAIPLFFGIQQLAEGFVWLSLSHGQYEAIQQVSIYAYTFFSHILWPIWIPFALLLFEEERKKKNILFGIFSIAMLLSLGEAYNVTAFGVQARIQGEHIQYFINFPHNFILISDVLYGLVTVVPCFVSSYKKMRLFSGTLILSVLIAHIFYTEWLISVWCFFAALLSLIVYAIINQLPEKQRAYSSR